MDVGSYYQVAIFHSQPADHLFFFILQKKTSLNIPDSNYSPLQVSIIHTFYTFIVFHFPFLNKIKATMVINVSAAGIDIKTPLGPMSRYFDKK